MKQNVTLCKKSETKCNKKSEKNSVKTETKCNTLHYKVKQSVTIYKKSEKNTGKTVTKCNTLPYKVKQNVTLCKKSETKCNKKSEKNSVKTETKCNTLKQSVTLNHYKGDYIMSIATLNNARVKMETGEYWNNGGKRQGENLLEISGKCGYFVDEIFKAYNPDLKRDFSFWLYHGNIIAMYDHTARKYHYSSSGWMSATTKDSKYVENELQIFFDTLLLKAMENTNISFHDGHILRTSFVESVAGSIEKAEKFHEDFSFMLYGDGKHIDEHVEEEEGET